jgi:hypothetical protein
LPNSTALASIEVSTTSSRLSLCDSSVNFSFLSAATVAVINATRHAGHSFQGSLGNSTAQFPGAERNASKRRGNESWRDVLKRHLSSKEKAPSSNTSIGSVPCQKQLTNGQYWETPETAEVENVMAGER